MGRSSSSGRMPCPTTTSTVDWRSKYRAIYRSSFEISRKASVSARPRSWNTTVSVAVTTAPACRACPSPSSDFAGVREHTASATTETRKSWRRRSSAVSSTHTCASIPARITGPAWSALRRSVNPSAAQQEKAVFSIGATSSRSARSSGSVRPRPRGYCSVTRTGTARRRAAAPRILMLRIISSRRSASMALNRRSCTSMITRTGCGGMRPPTGWGSTGNCPIFSRAPRAVEAAVLDGLRAVRGRQAVGAREVGDGECDLEHTVVAARREAQAAHGGGQEPFGLGRRRAEPSRLARRHLGVRADAGAAEALALALARPQDAGADRRRGLARPAALEVDRSQRGQLDVKVDPIQERSRDPAEVAAALARRADAVVERGAAAPARVGRGDELEPRGEVADASGPRDRHAPVLERLAERLEHVLLELRQLVEEQDAQMGEGDFARMRRAAASDQAPDPGRVIRGGE